MNNKKTKNDIHNLLKNGKRAQLNDLGIENIDLSNGVNAYAKYMNEEQNFINYNFAGNTKIIISFSKQFLNKNLKLEKTMRLRISRINGIIKSYKKI